MTEKSKAESRQGNDQTTADTISKTDKRAESGLIDQNLPPVDPTPQPGSGGGSDGDS